MIEKSQSADSNTERWIIAALDLSLKQPYKAVTRVTDGSSVNGNTMILS